MTHQKTNNTLQRDIGGFVAGTLVHTDKGLVPIEQIKVGDMVLSKPENGEGEVAYKPVVNLFEFEDKEIWLAKFTSRDCYPDEKFNSGEIPRCVDFVVGTPNHPFWVVGVIPFWADEPTIIYHPQAHWARLDQLEQGSVVLRADGYLACVYAAQPVFAMPNSELGFLQGYPLGDWWEHESGSYIDLSSSPKVYAKDFDTFFNEDMRDDSYSRHEWLFPIKERNVYNIELADYHTYFVGGRGILVQTTTSP